MYLTLGVVEGPKLCEDAYVCGVTLKTKPEKGLDSREPELTLGGPSLDLPDRASARYGREVSSGSKQS